MFPRMGSYGKETMSVVARWCQTRYSSLMTEFKPLAYVASVAVLVLVVAFAAAMQWNPVLRAKSLQAGWLMGMAGLRTLGVFIGAAAWIGSYFAWMLYLLTEMWSKRVAHIAWGWWQSLSLYCDRRAFHRPQHAA